MNIPAKVIIGTFVISCSLKQNSVRLSKGFCNDLIVFDLIRTWFDISPRTD